MSDPVVQQLKQAVAAHGNALPQNRGELEQALAGAAASFPGKVKALLLMLDKNAVAFLLNWSKETRPDKGTYEQLRQQIAGKFEQAKLINAAGAAWALDAWAYALGLREEPAAPAAPAPAGGLSLQEPPPPKPEPASGLSLQEMPHTPEPAPAAQAAAASTAAPAAASAARPAAAKPPVVTNPYAPPAASVEEPASETQEAAFIAEGRKVEAGRGYAWFTDAWEFFKLSPGIWVLNFFLFMLIVLAVQFVPFIGWIPGALLQPMLLGGIMLGALAQHRGEPLEVGHLFAGFKERGGSLALVGAFYLIGSIVIVVVVFLLMMFTGVGLAALMSGGPSQGMSGGVVVGVLLGVLLGLALFVPLLMAYWFAPALVAINGLSAFEAMKASFFGCLKNMLPFLIYGLVGLIVLIAVVVVTAIVWHFLTPFIALPFAVLVWFVISPVVLASIYTGYRDIFYDE